MTEFNIEYRGFEVPTKFLGGLFGANTLAAWKEGIDTALAAWHGVSEDAPGPEPKPAVRYAVDRDGWYFRGIGRDVRHVTAGHPEVVRELPHLDSFQDLLDNWYYGIKEIPESDVPSNVLAVFDR